MTTHKDIYNKFMIEYDKAEVTSSYPSLTQYEVATILDKAYLALIAQKFTGNNIRRMPFEGDVKVVADLHPLLERTSVDFYLSDHIPSVNASPFKLPDNYLYFVQLYLDYRVKSASDKAYLLESQVYNTTDPLFATDKNNTVEYRETYDNSKSSESVLRSSVYGDDIDDENFKTEHEQGEGSGNPYDQEYVRSVPCRLVPHNVAEKFFITPYNMPWVKIPVCYIEGDDVYVVYDTIKTPCVHEGDSAHFTYLKQPNKFVQPNNQVDFGDTHFQLSDSMAEELISTAVAMALENIESTRLNSKLNMRGLEA